MREGASDLPGYFTMSLGAAPSSAEIGPEERGHPIRLAGSDAAEMQPVVCFPHQRLL